jgi:hypothetical protein
MCSVSSARNAGSNTRFDFASSVRVISCGLNSCTPASFTVEIFARPPSSTTNTTRAASGSGVDSITQCALASR